MRRLTQFEQTIHAVYDVDGKRIAAYLFDENSGTSSLIREYIWANDMRVGVFGNGQMYFVRTDHIGRPVFATDSAGTKVWEASYLPFGGLQVSSGPNSNLRFPGQWFQAEAGLHQNWMRDYDPTTGRYMQADPLGLVDGASVYGYVTQNPARNVDPRGEQETPFVGKGDLTTYWGFEYHPRVLPGRERNQGPLERDAPFHNFPFAFDREIWESGYSCISSVTDTGHGVAGGYFNCRCVDGALNGKPGRYEVGVNIPFFWESPFGLGRPPIVTHRLFRPTN